MQSRILMERIEKNDAHEELFKTKAVHKFSQLQAKNHEDHLKHFQKIVQKDDDQEKDLYKTVKEAEFLRRKKDNEVKKMHDQLIELKRQNSIQIKQAIAKAFQEEEDFHQKLLREKAKLDKVR